MIKTKELKQIITDNKDTTHLLRTFLVPSPLFG